MISSAVDCLSQDRLSADGFDSELLDHEAPEQRNSLRAGPDYDVIASGHRQMLDEHRAGTDPTRRRGTNSHDFDRLIIRNRAGCDEQVMHGGEPGQPLRALAGDDAVDDLRHVLKLRVNGRKILEPLGDVRPRLLPERMPRQSAHHRRITAGLP